LTFLLSFFSAFAFFDSVFVFGFVSAGALATAFFSAFFSFLASLASFFSINLSTF